MERNLDLGAYVDPDAARIRLRDYVAEWLHTKVEVSPRTRDNITSRLNNHVLPVLGDLPLGSIRLTDVCSLQASLLQNELAPATVTSTMTSLGQVLGDAVRDGRLLRSPCDGLRKPGVRTRTEMAFLTPDEIARVAGAIEPQYSALVWTAAYTGLRAGELHGLRVEHLDLLHGRIRVEQTLTEDAKGHLIAGPTKTGKIRTVPIPRHLCRILDVHLQKFADPSGYVFSAPEGGPVRHHNFRTRCFYPAVQKASLGRKVRFHDLRHTHASLLIAQGVHPKAVQERLGHSSIRVTFDRYGHLLPSVDEELVHGLDATMSDSGVAWMWHEAADDPHFDAVEAPEGASDQDVCLERTTGFEPATLTLAR